MLEFNLNCMEKVRLRYGPSPTGIPHVGNIRTALFNYLFAKNQKGEFFLRIEDTDRARIVKGAVGKIEKSLKSLNLEWDGEVVIQSKRLPLYNSHLEKLKKNGSVYEEEGAWKFKIPQKNRKISWTDVVHGEVSYPDNVLEDFVLLKSDGFPTYHFASVVDDHEMQISHVLRGDEWIPSTPKHILLYEALGWDPPKFVHMPPIVGHDKKKLSKREGAKSTLDYIEEGYLPEAIVNFLVFLGWSPKGNQELFSKDELIKEFSLDRINKNSPIFNVEKLNWFNGQWIRKIEEEKLVSYIKGRFPKYDETIIKKVLPLLRDRMKIINDFQIAKLFFEAPLKKPKILISKNQLDKLTGELEKTAKWEKAEIENSVAKIMESEKIEKPQMYRSIGLAISGSTITPPLIESLVILGKEDVLKRLTSAT